MVLSSIDASDIQRREVNYDSRESEDSSCGTCGEKGRWFFESA